MSDQLWGILIGGGLTLLAGFLAATYQARHQEGAENRARAMARRDRIRQYRLEALRATHRHYVTLAEHARAAVAGEDETQIARLRQQLESSANLDSDATLYNAPAIVGEFLENLRTTLDRGRGTGMTMADVELHATIERKLGEAYRRQLLEIIEDADSDGSKK